ncbi:MAG: mechanosensitive ion channel family protein [Chloroflexi bacterium]|nr:mechanosensitive ion channel family protein [Chloroflexota bacterium]
MREITSSTATCAFGRKAENQPPANNAFLPAKAVVLIVADERGKGPEEEGGEPTTAEQAANRKRAFTAAGLLRHTLRYVIVVAAGYSIIVLLTIAYPQLVGLVAGLGVASVAVAFGAQALLRDIIAGFFIIVENQYAVGDVVRIRLNGFEAFGIVEELSLRFTKIRDLNGHVRFVPNGGILGVDRYSAGYATYRLDFLLPWDGNTAAETAIAKISELYSGHPLLLGPISLDRINESKRGWLAVASVKAAPGAEWFIDKICGAVSAEVKEMMQLSAAPLASYYEINDEALALYERSVFVG